MPGSETGLRTAARPAPTDLFSEELSAMAGPGDMAAGDPLGPARPPAAKSRWDMRYLILGGAAVGGLILVVVVILWLIGGASPRSADKPELPSEASVATEPPAAPAALPAERPQPQMDSPAPASTPQSPKPSPGPTTAAAQELAWSVEPDPAAKATRPCYQGLIPASSPEMGSMSSISGLCFTHPDMGRLVGIRVRQDPKNRATRGDTVFVYTLCSYDLFRGKMHSWVELPPGDVRLMDVSPSGEVAVVRAGSGQYQLELGPYPKRSDWASSRLTRTIRSIRPT